ncbi:MAG: dephospho-CoA kinase [Candidatus Thermochlorobacter aerophilum]|jgi:dephospho-CoA kinase|uniref:Dephospho-CoA kinase n=1 Tax=Candidatus Thermochlorobacter aerophilus TaxID=1868324 RepID=A0A395LZ38_9BACT|nr:MAG: dephospho-CoA kinase [Candidatus Thermochlorobacter aerophilum]
MRVIGVTGGIGSGKTTVCNILNALGCRIFNADQVAKELQETDPEVIAGIKALFGEEIYTGNVPNRKKIAQLVFSDKEKLMALNRLIHPKVFARFYEAKLDAERKGERVLVKEAAILFESGGNKQVDETIAVLADRDLRIKRLEGKGLTRDEIEQRMSMQLSDDELRQRADHVIENNGTLEELQSKVKKTLEKILTPTPVTSR